MHSTFALIFVVAVVGWWGEEESHENGSTAKAKPCYSSLNKLSGPADKTVQVKLDVSMVNGI